MTRFEWFLEKATELGVYRITPILCKRSERKKLNINRCEKIIYSALKQSLGAYCPILDPLTKLNNVDTYAEFTYIAHCQDSSTKSLKKIVTKNKNSCILIGPEGDFTSSEIMWAKSKGILTVDLGKNRFRTETAALIALHTAQLMHEL